MKHYARTVTAALIATVICSMAAAFTINTTVGDRAAETPSGEHLVIFSLFQGGNAQTADSGTLIYGEIKQLQIADGQITHELGTGEKTFGPPLEDAIPANGDLFVQVALDKPENVVLPRTAIATAARASVASDSERLGGFPAEDFATKSDLSLLQSKSIQADGPVSKAPGTGANSTIGGGAANTASGDYSTVGGGGYNTASGPSSTIAGGFQNTASGVGSGVAAGYLNRALGTYSIASGGSNNTASGGYSAVGGGGSNNAAGVSSTIAGGYGNQATQNGAAVGGGVGNQAIAEFATVAGGGPYYNPGLDTTTYNRATDQHCTVGGGAGNQAGNADSNLTNSPYATVSGGLLNKASGLYATVAGGFINEATANSSAVGGGSQNRAPGFGGFVGGGNQNTASGAYSTVAGGFDNLASGLQSAVGGGDSNRATASEATVAGGYNNWASATDSTVGGGSSNLSTGYRSTVAGGYSNVALGQYSTVPGGNMNAANADHSFAAGRNAKAQHQGAFVWADSVASDFLSTANNQFAVRCIGGARFVSGVSPGTAGVELPPGAGSWSSLSDKNAKTNILAVNARAILAALASIPISTWNYKTQDEEIRHIGPMAQDFAKAFGVGEDDTHISTVDADGVALAAIQGLYQEVLERDRKIKDLEERLSRLEKLVDKQ